MPENPENPENEIINFETPPYGSLIKVEGRLALVIASNEGMEITLQYLDDKSVEHISPALLVLQKGIRHSLGWLRHIEGPTSDLTPDDYEVVDHFFPDENVATNTLVYGFYKKLKVI